MNYSEEYVEQLEKVIAALRGENAELREKLAAAEKENEFLRGQMKETVRPAAVGGKKDSLMTFFELTEEELRALAPVSAKPGSAQDFEIKDGVLKKYVGEGGDVVIPDGVTSIGDRAFENCKSLTSITIPDGVTSIGSLAFACCKSLTSLIIPDGVTSIGYAAFARCESLTSLIIPDSVTRIGDWAFKGSCKLTIKCKANSYMGKYCRNNKINYTELTEEDRKPLPFEEYEINDGVLEKYNGRGNNVVIPSGVTRIGEEAFAGCIGLTELAVPSGVTSIGDKAFAGCIALKSVTIPNSVKHISSSAFVGCYNLTIKCDPSSYAGIYCRNNKLNYTTSV